jgi:hypothetical protein
MSNRRVGRPKKYSHFIAALEDETAYTPAAIFRHAKECGLLSQQKLRTIKKSRLRVRHTMARLAANYGFPPEGDAPVKLPGQSYTFGWYGKRWKSTLTDSEKQRASKMLNRSGCAQ